MKRERIYLYDTTLRDGQQTQGVNFTVDDKVRISNALDELGIDYVEGGWPGANPTDSDFFNTNPQLKATFNTPLSIYYCIIVITMAPWWYV